MSAYRPVGVDEEWNLPPEARVALAGSAELSAVFVAVRTSDGHPLPPNTIVVLTLDKTLAQVTAAPAANIANISFEET